MHFAVSELSGFLNRQDVLAMFARCFHGIEREGLRIDAKGRLAKTFHPPAFGSKLHNPYISTDFSEAQLELITPYYKNLEEAFHFLHDLHLFVYQHLGNELIWPFSPPGVLPKASDIPLADYGSSEAGQLKTLYRKALGYRYGRKMQTLSGIHYNFSLPDEFFAQLNQEKSLSQLSPKELISDVYFAMARNYLRLGWLNTYLFGASPAVDVTFFDRKPYELRALDEHTLFSEYATSLRTSSLGYYSKVQTQISISYNSLQSYVRDLWNALDESVPRFERIGVYRKGERVQINTNYLQLEAEAYARIRPKPDLSKGSRPVEALDKGGVKYLEVRTVDVNPFCPNGIECEQLVFLHLFMLHCLLRESPRIELSDQTCIRNNQNLVALQGRKPRLMLRKVRGEAVSLKDWAREILESMQPLAASLDQITNSNRYSAAIDSAYLKVHNPDLCTSAKVLQSLEDGGLSLREFGLRQAKNHLDHFAKEELSVPVRANLTEVAINSVQATKNLEIKDDMVLSGFEDLEWSTQMIMREAKKQGIEIEVADRKTNLIWLKQGKKTQFIQQASMTAKDNLVSYFLMGNKHVTKSILKKAKINVPRGSVVTDIESGLKAYEELASVKVVIKPNDTNYGEGIYFIEPHDLESAKVALASALKLSAEVLIEEFCAGMECRFLVIAGKVEGICQRIPANVIGDGVATIAELVHRKNADPMAFKWKDYQIRLGDEENAFLKAQGYQPETVLEKDKQVFLRGNSNVSTGGDPIDMTDRVHQGYSKIALKAVKELGANFCGLDMIIRDIKRAPTSSNYAILELNYNPALYLHRYPVVGKKRYVEKAVLKALGFTLKH